MPLSYSPALSGLGQDVKYTFRGFRREPAFAAFAILIVGLGVAASTTVFSAVDALLLRPLPLRDPKALV